MKKTLILMILDGFGCGRDYPGNAIKAAKKPNIDRIFSSNPITQIGASGMDVGLPDGQMGNSDVGHTNIGGPHCVSGVDSYYKIHFRRGFFLQRSFSRRYGKL